MSGSQKEWVLWASTLSPFALEVSLCCDHAGLAHRWLPRDGSSAEGLRFQARRRAVVRGRLPLTWPRPDPLDEFPLVPFLFGPGGENLYDSSAIAEWLDLHWTGRRAGASPLLPARDPALRFAVRLLDEALDELGLYLAHHNRWVVAARDNGAGRRLAAEFRPLAGPLAPLLGRWFAARQVRRLPYLFSVGDGRGFEDLPARLRPPARAGFPPTHALLEELFARLLAALEPLLSARPFVFWERFTLADASVFGQLAMNRSDPSADAWIASDAPAVHAWLVRLERRDFGGDGASGQLVLDAAVAPLLAWACQGFVPLMQQNRAAWQRHVDAGETLFNERGFDAGRALYDGELLGHPFRSVAKTFQVRVWRDLRRDWDALGEASRARLEALLPPAHGLDRS